MASGTSISPPITGKRKREGVPKFYAVHTGHKPGVYTNWPDCLAQVTGFKNASFKSFTTLTEADAFVNGNGSTTSSATSPKGSKFYGVKVGRQPGVYASWPEAQAQVIGWKGPKYKSFLTRAEAEAFVKGDDGAQTEKKTNGTTTHEPPTTDASTKPPPNKKARKSLDQPFPPGDGEYEAGTGPLPPNSEDDFDSRILLNPSTGKPQYKTARQLAAKKWRATEPVGPIRIYTDGSALGNGGARAIAGVGVFFGPQDPRNVSESLKGTRQTNQRAELTAILRALELCPRDRAAVVVSDSTYAIKCVTDWFQAWERSGWLTAAKKPVENRDLVEAVLVHIRDRAAQGSNTHFEWVKGHAADPGNQAADRLAVDGARAAAAV